MLAMLVGVVMDTVSAAALHDMADGVNENRDAGDSLQTTRTRPTGAACFNHR